jgi:hypothetical protein
MILELQQSGIFLPPAMTKETAVSQSKSSASCDEHIWTAKDVRIFTIKHAWNKLSICESDSKTSQKMNQS